MNKLRNVLNISLYSVIRNFRDYRTLCLMLLFPIVLVLILGTALGSTFTPDTIGKIPVSYLCEDNGYAARAFEGFLSSSKVKEILEIKRAESLDEGLKQVNSGESLAMIHIGAGFTKGLEEGKKAEVQVYSDQYRSFKVTIVKNIIDSFVENANANMAATRLGASNPDYSKSDNIVEMPVSSNGKTPRAIDYYAVTMLVMTMMYGTSYGTYAMGGDRTSKTDIRLKAAPVSSTEIVFGKVLGTIATIFLQAVILIAFTRFAYKANWGDNIGFILFICLSVIVMSVSLGIMAFSVFKSARKASLFLSVFVVVMTFVGGGYFPISQLSPKFLRYSILSPNYLAQKAIFNTVFLGSPKETFNGILAIWCLAAVSVLVSIIFSRRTEN